MGKVILKTEKTSRFGKDITMSELGTEPIKVSSNGTIIVDDENIAKAIVDSDTGWDYFKKENKAKAKAPAAPANEEEEEEEELEDETGNEEEEEAGEADMEEIIASIQTMKAAELNELAEKLNLTEVEGWNPNMKVVDKRAWITGQLSAEEEE